MKIPRAILLDLDNTVYSYLPCQEGGLVSAHKIALEISSDWKDYGLFLEDYSQARFHVQNRIKGHGASHCRLLYFHNLLEMKIGKSSMRWARRMHENFWQGYFSKMVLDEGCAEGLLFLRSHGVRVACVTNLTTERQMEKLEKLGLDKFLEFLVTSEEAGADKPSSLPFSLALEKLKLKPQDCCVIGDDFLADLKPGKELGMETLLRRREVNAQAARLAGFDHWSQIPSLFSGE